METKWADITVEFTEYYDCTDAKVYATVGGERFNGWGRARRNPVDPQVPEVGQELALARALADLSDHLLDIASETIGEREGRRVTLEL